MGLFLWGLGCVCVVGFFPGKCNVNDVNTRNFWKVGCKICKMEKA